MNIIKIKNIIFMGLSLSWFVGVIYFHDNDSKDFQMNHRIQINRTSQKLLKVSEEAPEPHVLIKSVSRSYMMP